MLKIAPKKKKNPTPTNYIGAVLGDNVRQERQTYVMLWQSCQNPPESDYLFFIRFIYFIMVVKR